MQILDRFFSPGITSALFAIFTVKVSARFSDTGTSVLVTFDQNTDYGEVTNIGGSFDCALLLDYPGVNDADACSWTSGEKFSVEVYCRLWKLGAARLP